MLGSAEASFVSVRSGKAGLARHGKARRGKVWQARLGRARLGVARQGMAGKARSVQVWQCWVRCGLAGHGRLGMVCSGGER